jgi:ABC-type branched-subunit amino acid transport system substrate-binding protein
VPVVAQYRLALAKVPDAHPGYVSLEGYLGGRVLVAALQHIAAGTAPTREALMLACEGLHDLDLGGFKVAYDATSHQASERVYLTVIQQGAAVPVERLQR